MSDRLQAEAALLRRVHPELELVEEGWVRLASYALPPGWSRAEVKLASRPSVGVQPYGFWVHPGITLADGRQPTNYTPSVDTPFGPGWVSSPGRPRPGDRMPKSRKATTCSTSSAQSERGSVTFSEPMSDLQIHQFAELRRHLSELERVAFMYANVQAGCFIVDDLEPMLDDDISSQSHLHVVLHDHIRPRLISRASARGQSLIEAHSHGPRGRAAFSPSDLLGFSEWVPHLWWRLKGCPYAALVMAGTQWDALAWIDGPREPESVAAIEVMADKNSSRIAPTNATFRSLTAPNRQDAETR